MESYPLVSVITVCFNAENCIIPTMDSVLAQDYPNLEYILIDGASTDSTLQLICSKEKDFADRNIPLVIVSEPDKGIYDAMNKGLKLAKGKWINFMNAGDNFYSGNVLSSFFSNTDYREAKVVYGNTVLALDFGEIEMLPKPVDYLRKKMSFCHQSVFVDGDLMRKEKFDTSFRLAADYAFFYRYYMQGGKFHYVEKVVARFESEQGASSKNRLQVNREYARIHGVENTAKWKIWFAFKCLRVHLKEALHSMIPKSYLGKIREKNYRRIVKNRKR